MPRTRNKLDEYDAIHIYTVNLPYALLVNWFGVTKTSISDIKNGKRWRQVTQGFEISKCHAGVVKP